MVGVVPRMVAIVPRMGVAPTMVGVVPRIVGVVPRMVGVAPRMVGVVPRMVGVAPTMVGMVAADPMDRLGGLRHPLGAGSCPFWCSQMAHSDCIPRGSRGTGQRPLKNTQLQAARS